jgi:hypothetical protein
MCRRRWTSRQETHDEGLGGMHAGNSERKPTQDAILAWHRRISAERKVAQARQGIVAVRVYHQE